MPKINIGDVDLFFDVYGSKLKITKTEVLEKPTLIHLHGGPGLADHTIYVEFWSQFFDIAQVIFIDQRANGRSPAPDRSKWNLKQWGQDIYRFCKALDIQKPIVSGLSWGGHSLCSYATQYPGHASGLIFTNTEARFNLNLICKKMEKIGGKAAAEAARDNFCHPTPENNERYIKLCVPHYAKNAYTIQEMNRCIKNLEVFRYYAEHEALTFNYLDQLHRITCPTLFMVGEISPIHPYEEAESMTKAMNPELVNYYLFKGAGAPVYKDLPQEAYQVVYNFIQDIISKENKHK